VAGTGACLAEQAHDDGMCTDIDAAYRSSEARVRSQFTNISRQLLVPGSVRKNFLPRRSGELMTADSVRRRHVIAVGTRRGHDGVPSFRDRYVAPQIASEAVRPQNSLWKKALCRPYRMSCSARCRYSRGNGGFRVDFEIRNFCGKARPSRTFFHPDPNRVGVEDPAAP